MADIFKNNTTNSSTIMCFTSNSGWITAIAVPSLFVAFFCSSMVIYLSLRLRKRAWDTPAKRFSHILTILVFFICLIEATVTFWDPSVMYGYIVVALLQYIFRLIFLYFTASLLTLLFQISVPFLPDCLKKHLPHNSRFSNFTEVTIHVLVQIVSVLTLIPLFYQYNQDSGCLNFSFIIYILMFSFCSSSFIVFLCLILFGLLLIKFLRNHSINRGIKIMIFKLGFLFVIDLLITVYYPLVMFREFSPLHYTFGFIVLYAILFVSVVTLNYPLDTWCCKCFRKSPLREPLLLVSNTERQQTNPDSVWDHRNVPSYTATNYPNEMSDCRTDNVQQQMF